MSNPFKVGEYVKVDGYGKALLVTSIRGDWVRVNGHASGLHYSRYTPASPSKVKAAPDVPHNGKDDSSKPDPTMLFTGCARALEQVQLVLEGGAKKYSAGSWRQVDNGIERYWKAFSRHKVAVDLGGLNAVNPDFGLLHIDHMICDLLFIRELMIARDAQHGAGHWEQTFHAIE